MNENPFDYGMNENGQETAQTVPQNENIEPQRAAFEQPVQQAEPQTYAGEQARTQEAPQAQAYGAPQMQTPGVQQEHANEQTPRAAAQEQPQTPHAQADRPMQQQAGEQYYRPAQPFCQQPDYGRQSSPCYTPYSSYPNYGGYAAQTPPAPPVPPRAAAPAGAPKQPKRAKKHNGLGVKVAVLALCCALIGSLAGGAIVGAVLHNDEQQPASTGQSVSSSSSHTQAAKVNSDGSLMTPSQIYEANVPAIVGIANESTSYNIFGQVSETASSGTGFIISSDGEILTNYHVVENAKSLTVTTSDGTQYDATVVGYEADSDVALLKIDATDLPTVSLGSSNELGVGDQVAAIGNPLGELTYSLTVGYVSAKDRAVNTDGSPINMMQIDAAINPGNSGGPTFNAAGQVIGINSSIASTAASSDSAGSIGIGFAIPSNLVKRVADEIIKDGKVKHVALGVVIKSDTVEADGVTRGGATITKSSATGSAVVSGGPADKAGLKEGDTIVAFNGNAVNNNYSLLGYVRAAALGDKVTLTIVRDGKTMDVDVTLDQEESSVNGSSSSDSNGNSQNKQNNQNGNGQNGYGNGNGNGNSDGGTGDGGGFSDPFGLW